MSRRRRSSSLVMEATADRSLPSWITCHMTCADNWRALQVLWLNTRAASASDTPSRWPPPGPTWRCSSPGIWILLEPFKHIGGGGGGEGVWGGCTEEGSSICRPGPTTALHDAISFTRSITSWLKVVGQKTCDTRPRLHASCTVSFLPQNSISLACRWGDSDEVSPFQFTVKETEPLSVIPTRATPRIWGNV